MKDKLSSPLESYEMNKDELWKHSVFTAFAAEELSHHCQGVSICPSDAFRAGLLHDIGKVMTNYFLTKHKGEMVELASSQMLDAYKFESKHIYMNHAHFGGQMLKFWNLPDRICDAIYFHHTPAETDNPLASLAHLADPIAHITGNSFGYTALMGEMNDAAYGALGLDLESFYQVMVEIQEKQPEIKKMVGIDT